MFYRHTSKNSEDNQSHEVKSEGSIWNLLWMTSKLQSFICCTLPLLIKIHFSSTVTLRSKKLQFLLSLGSWFLQFVYLIICKKISHKQDLCKEKFFDAWFLCYNDTSYLCIMICDQKWFVHLDLLHYCLLLCDLRVLYLMLVTPNQNLRCPIYITHSINIPLLNLNTKSKWHWAADIFM